MATKAEQQGLPGVPQAPKRKIIDELEDISLEIDKLAGKATAASDAKAVKIAERQALIVKHKLTLYTYENGDGVLQDVFLETVTKKRKSKLNQKQEKKGADA